jgi:hypothetical protein
MGRLSVLTGDSFYAEFYKLLSQTMASYQAYDSKYPFFSIGLVPSRDREGPIDVVGETHNGHIGVGIIPFGTAYLLDISSEDSYHYVGGPDWGVGLDYVLPFHPKFDEDLYLAACTFYLCDACYDKAQETMRLTTAGDARGQVLLYSRAKPIGLLYSRAKPIGLRLLVNGAEVDVSGNIQYNTQNGILAVTL